MTKTSKQSSRLLTLVNYNDPILRKVTEIVKFPLNELDRQLIQDMKYSINLPPLKDGLAGMAANQWGKNKQIFLFNPSGNINELEVIINPSYEPIIDAVTKKPLSDNAWEACFSIPLAVGKIKRYTHIKVTYQNESGNIIKRELTGWPARVWQHENDHLNGILYDDPKSGKCLEKKQFASEEELDAFYKLIREERLKNNPVK